MILWWNESGEVVACHRNRGGFEVPPPAFAGSMEIPDTLGDVVGAAPRFHRVSGGVVEITEDEGQSWAAAEIPPGPVPNQVTGTQAKLALIDAGLYEAVEYWVLGAEPLPTGMRYRVVWDASNWYRTSPELNDIAADIGMTSGQVDDLFRLAATK